MNNFKTTYDFSNITNEYIVLFDGKKNKNIKTFLENIWLQLKFPEEPNHNWDAYLDWMRDLSWIKEKNILIIIENFKHFLSDEPTNKTYFLSDFSSVIFPFWEDSAIEVFGNEKMIKNITFVCLNGEAKINMENTTEKINVNITTNILNNQKTPHANSVPVLRMENDKLYLATFTFFYNADELRSGMVRRPSLWALFDIETGNLIEKYYTPENDFSNYEYDKLYNISFNKKLHNDYYHSLNFLLDIIRQEYILNKTINEKLYNQYLEKILDTTPEEYQIFYKDLSKLEN